MPSGDPAYQQLRGFTEKSALLKGMLGLQGTLSKGDRSEVGNVRTVRIAAGKDGEGGTLDVSLQGTPYPLRFERAGGAGVLELADWNKDFALAAPAKGDTVDYGSSCPRPDRAPGPQAPALVGAGVQRRFRFRSSTGQRRRHRVPGRGRGGHRGRGQGACRGRLRGPAGVRRSRRHSAAQRAGIASPSGAFSRLPFSSATAASHAAVPGGISRDLSPSRPPARPPLSLERTVTVAVPPSARPSSGCSPGPPPTTYAAPSIHACHSARSATGCRAPR